MASHKRPEVEVRLSRIEGHIRSIRRMVQEDRTYPEIVQQISAVDAALDAVVQVIVDDLVEDCVKKVERNATANRTLRELKEVVARAR